VEVDQFDPLLWLTRMLWLPQAATVVDAVFATDSPVRFTLVCAAVVKICPPSVVFKMMPLPAIYPVVDETKRTA
jgi:hypothetical protein